MIYLKLTLETENLSLFEENFEEYGSLIISGVLGFEKPTHDILALAFSRWQVQLIPYSQNDIAFLKTAINDRQSFLNYIVCSIEEDSWDKVSYAANHNEIFLQIDNIIISNDVNNLQNASKVNIFMEESLGFGTGKHDTTYLCLKLLQQLRDKNIQNILDIGTGSGILAIAVAKLLSQPVLATDIDELALSTAKGFITHNKVNHLVKTLNSEGFKKIPTQQFSLIMANILLNPLIDMREDFNRYIPPQGYIIISGILHSQSKILKARFKEWLVVKELKQNGWSAILLQKKPQNNH